jgi:hypothetical protein
MGRNRKNKKGKGSKKPSSAAIGNKIKAALRSIIRDWQSLHSPLFVDNVPVDVLSGSHRFRVPAAESAEELQERVIQFAGRVWQLKDGLIKWLKVSPALKINFRDSLGRTVTGGGGASAVKTIEDIAKLSLPLLLCADLYNTHKHYDDCDRSRYQPFLNGVQFDTSRAGVLAIRFDGARQLGELMVENKTPVPLRIEIHSRNQQVCFGDAIVIVGRAFRHWLSIIRSMGILSASDVVDKAILHDLAKIETEIDSAKPFKEGEKAIDLDKLTIEQRQLAESDPAAFKASRPQKVEREEMIE